ncbi:MAG: LytTR family DNA-binding domain-containing protein [Acidobacteriaceae bacterium]
MPGWKATYSSQEGPPGRSSEPVLSDPSQPRVTETGPPYGIDAVHELRRVSRTTAERYLSRIAVKAGEKIVLVSMKDVLWIQSHGNLVRLHLQDTSYEHRTTIKDAYTHLDPERFVRVHRNAIVNLDHVAEFDLPRYGNAFVHLRNGKALPISRTARTVLRRELLSQTYPSMGANDI